MSKIPMMMYGVKWCRLREAFPEIKGVADQRLYGETKRRRSRSSKILNS